MQAFLRMVYRSPFLVRLKDITLDLLSKILRRYFKKEIPLEKVRNLLFIRFEPHLGSIMCSTPIFESIRKRFPNGRIGAICDDMNYQILKYNPNIHEIYTAPNPDRNFLKTVRFFLRFRKQEKGRYDCIIADLGNSNFRYCLPTLLAGIRYRISFEGRHDFLYNLTVSYTWQQSIIERNLNLLSIFNRLPVPTDREAKIYFSEHEIAFVERFFKRNGADEGKLNVAMQTQSKDEKPNRWYDDRFAELADMIIERFDANIIFIGSMDQVQNIEQIRGKMAYPSVSAAGETDIPQLAAMLSICDLMVTLDTGTMHVGRAVEVPMVIIGSAYQPSHLWLPIGIDRHVILRKGDLFCALCSKDYCSSRECMKQITVAEVFAAVEHQVRRFAGIDLQMMRRKRQQNLKSSQNQKALRTL